MKTKKLKQINVSKKESKKDRILLIVALFFIIAGGIAFLYPNVSNYFENKNHTEAIRKYDEEVSNYDDKKIEEELEKAKIYNENLSGDPVHDPFMEGSGYAIPENYKEVLNISDDGIMGYIEIPKISVYLPIYHGTSSEVLSNGVGHIDTTSLPIGGKSTHSVLTGHTGLPSAELFTRINELETGDIFYIHVLNKTLTYKVYDKKVILPKEIGELQITKGKDYVTLVTCTPYGVNTHRLLVKAERTKYEKYENNSTKNKDKENKNFKSINYTLLGIIIGFICFILITTLLLIIKTKKIKKKH